VAEELEGFRFFFSGGELGSLLVCFASVSGWVFVARTLGFRFLLVAFEGPERSPVTGSKFSLSSSTIMVEPVDDVTLFVKGRLTNTFGRKTLARKGWLEGES